MMYEKMFFLKNVLLENGYPNKLFFRVYTFGYTDSKKIPLKELEILKNLILFGMKRSNFIVAILLLIVSCTSKKEVATRKPEQTRESINEIYSKDDLIGDWVFFHTELVKGNKSDRNPLISKKNFVDDDSLIVSLKADGELKINDVGTGSWSLKNDSLMLKGDREFRDFPLFLDTKYEVHKGKFSKNWYFYCTFYSSDRKIHHTVKYRARKRGNK
ncbi:MAG: hypothetical protein ACBR18_29695 [Microcoleus sp.]